MDADRAIVSPRSYRADRRGFVRTSRWGAGAGTTERYDYRCPCGDGKIIEDHDNIPGFREHDVWIACEKCRAEWRFVERRGVRGWALEPVAVRPAA